MKWHFTFKTDVKPFCTAPKMRHGKRPIFLCPQRIQNSNRNNNNNNKINRNHFPVENHLRFFSSSSSRYKLSNAFNIPSYLNARNSCENIKCFRVFFLFHFFLHRFNIDIYVSLNLLNIETSSLRILFIVQIQIKWIHENGYNFLNATFYVHIPSSP